MIIFYTNADSSSCPVRQLAPSSPNCLELLSSLRTCWRCLRRTTISRHRRCRVHIYRHSATTTLVFATVIRDVYTHEQVFEAIQPFFPSGPSVCFVCFVVKTDKWRQAFHYYSVSSWTGIPVYIPRHCCVLFLTFNTLIQ